MPILLNNVLKDVDCYLQQLKTQLRTEHDLLTFCNERELQITMAAFLRGCHHYDNVFTEYPVTLEEIQYFRKANFSKELLTEKEFPWRKKDDSASLSIDIVVEKDNQFVPIELKYKREAIKTDVLPFGEPNPGNLSRNILEDQHAYPYNKYLVWKDVRRLEVINDAFRNVVGGIVVFITNDEAYWDPTRQEGIAIEFPTIGQCNAGIKTMQGNTADNCKSFTLNNSYTITEGKGKSEGWWQDVAVVNIGSTSKTTTLRAAQIVIGNNKSQDCLAMPKENQVFWKDYFFCITPERKMIGGRLCQDLNPGSTQNAINILMNIARAKGVPVKISNYLFPVEGDTDLDAFARKTIKEEGTNNYYVYGDFTLAVNPDGNELGVYGCGNIKQCLYEAEEEADFVSDEDWNTIQRHLNFIKYLIRMKGYADDSLRIEEPTATAYSAFGASTLNHSFSHGSPAEIEASVGDDYYRYGNKGMATFLVGYVNNEKKGEHVSLSRAISRIIYPEHGKPIKKYHVFDLTKVKDVRQFWTDLFVLTDYKAYTYIFTGLGLVKDEYLQDLVVYMMKREEYCPSFLFGKPMVDFSELNPILINQVDSPYDIIPAYASSKSLQVYIEKI